MGELMSPQPRRRRLDDAAAEPIDADDLRVLSDVAKVYSTLDPVPSGLVDRIRFGITLDALHAEIAELQRAGGLAGVRTSGATAAQTVTFTSPSLTTMVTITPTSTDRVRLDGWVAPGGGVEVELRLVGVTLSVTADANGRFVFDDVPRGLAKFLLRPPTGGPPSVVVTPSIEL
jgi:hypothetical protein